MIPSLPDISFWEKQWLAKADIVVVGTGIVGLQCAQRLKEQYPHRQVWAIDRAPLSMGASMRNAGFACFGSMGEILDDIVRTSENEAYTLYAKRFSGIKMLLDEYGETSIGYEKTGGHEIFEENKKDELDAILEKIDKVNSALKNITGENPFLPKPTAKLGMKILDTGIFTPFEGALQTHLLYKQILSKAMAVGVQVLSGLTVTDIRPEPGNRWRLVTENGYSVLCNQLVLCTNGFTKRLIEDVEVEPARGQVLVTSQIPSLAWRGLMHADKGYIYFRSLGSRILIGGARNIDFEGESTAELGENREITEKLFSFLQEVVVPGEKFEITDAWSGIMGMHQNRTPIVKQWQPNLFTCVRMGGMGVALSALVSRELVELVKNS